MADEKNSISRRNVLAGLGAIGVGGALAGAGTSAFFSDKETFKGNKLVTGELDLKVDWEEHYSDWSDDEVDGVGTWSMEPRDNLFGFPSTAPTAEQSVFVENEQQFMHNTLIEAFPDQTATTNPDDANYDASQEVIDDEICDLMADLDYVLDHPYRTRGTFGGEPNPQTTKKGDPLVNITDVKPGDFGEVTFSFHLCGNPGYVWLTGELVDAHDSSNKPEPERKDPDEITEPDPDVDGEYVELLDEIRASFWYDTGLDGEYGTKPKDKDFGEGSNIFGQGETLLPLSGSLRSVLKALENEMFPLDPEPVSNGGGDNGGGDGTTAPTVSGVIDGDTPEIDEIIVTGEDTRFGGTRNYQCADYEERLARFEPGDIIGSEVLNPDTAPIEPGMEYGGCTNITVDSVGDNGEITLSSSGPVIIVSVKGGTEGEQVYVFDEPVVLQEATFSTPTGQDISNVDVCCLLDGDNGHMNGDRECFENSTTVYIGFEWWLPVDHANEIQTDSVEFNLGFYTEQCRHNDGSGMPPETPTDNSGTPE